jgi:hypothetical protein
VPGVTAVDVEGEPSTSAMTYVVDADRKVGEALATAVVEGGFGLLAMEPAPVDLEALFLRLTAARTEMTR